ncbi:MAG: metallophosphoesterase, partial [Lacipirellulaceae bacterium]
MNWFLIAVALVGHGFLWVAIVNRLHACPVVRWLLEALTRLSLLLFLCLPVVIAWIGFQQPSSLFQPFTSEATWATYYCWLCIWVCVLSLFAKVFEERNRYDSKVVVESTSQLHDLSESLSEEPYLTDFAKRLARVPGNQTMQLHVENRRLKLPALPAELEGTRIVHLSDIHMAGRLERRYYEQLVEVVNEQQPDVIFVTGDIVEKTECWPWLETTLAPMRARLGRYFILGNHDLFIDEAETIKRLQELGWTYVGDQWEQTSWEGVPVSIGGNELHWKGPPAEP